MSEKKISLIVPVYYEEEVLPIAYPRMRDALQRTGHDYEILFVNDGSRDGTMRELRKIAAEDKRVKVLSFSRNFGHQLAVTAGMDEATGDALIIIDADLQDPPELIPDMVKLWEQDFRLIGRNVADVFLKMREHGRFLRGMSAWMGFEAVPLEYVRQERAAGKTKYTLKKMLKLALDGITGFSTKPLTMPLYLGGAVMGLSLLGCIAVLVCALTVGAAAWLWALCGVCLLLGAVLFFLGVQGAYIGRIFEESKARPLYIVAEKINL